MAEFPTAGDAEAAMLRGFRGEREPRGLEVSLVGNRLTITGDPALLYQIAEQVIGRVATASWEHRPARVTE